MNEWLVDVLLPLKGENRKNDLSYQGSINSNAK
jgi:hypothetical protein